MRDWMQPQSIANFNTRQECLKTLYSSYKVDDINVNCNLTIGESTADYAGVKAAYEALTASSTTHQQDGSSSPRLRSFNAKIQGQRL